jgi:MinD superfamily P-loop ATPase
MMNIAIASGKGGTGKTTIATNLSVLLGTLGKRVRYLDCDVEEPNGHLFLKPSLDGAQEASIPIPVIDENACTACGECVRFCEYRALVRLGDLVMVFAELCHGCGGCTRVCPHNAITEKPEPIGVVETGSSGEVGFVHGRLDVGQAMSPPLIRRVLEQTDEEAVNIIDAPPGTSCPVIASIRKADYAVLVTEPTPFGLNDLALALDMVTELGLSHGVVINRAEEGDEAAREFCRRRGARVIAEIPDDRRIAEVYSRGEMIIDGVPGLHEVFLKMWHSIVEQVNT